MEHIAKTLKNDYDRVVRAYSPRTACAGCCISEQDVLKAHYLISDYFIDDGESVVYGVKNYDLLSSAVYRQATSIGDIEKWPTDFQKMATLLFGLVKNHAFHDGNKRTALLILLLYIDRRNLQVKVQQSKIETLVIRIAANKLNEYPTFSKYANNDEPEINFIADLLKKYTRHTNKRYYTITYAELDQKLRKFGVWLDKPSGNYINVYKTTTIKKMFSESPKDIKILQIGFPGWKKQVNPKALKEVLKESHLTAEYGIDSDVFYNGAEPMYVLINEYRNPLSRLKDK